MIVERFDSAERNEAGPYHRKILRLSMAIRSCDCRQNGLIIGSLLWFYRESRYRIACRIKVSKIRRAV